MRTLAITVGLLLIIAGVAIGAFSGTICPGLLVLAGGLIVCWAA